MGLARRSTRLPGWVRESGQGVMGLLVGLLALDYGWQAALRGIEIGLEIDRGPPILMETLVESVAIALLLVGLYGLVGLGLPIGYHRVRRLEPPTVLRRPDRQSLQWGGAVVGAAVGLVLAATAVNLARGALFGDGRGYVPITVVGDPTGPLPQFTAGPFGVGFTVTIGVTTLALGLGVGGLFHGILQRSLRREMAATTAAVGISVPLGAFYGVPAGPIAFVVVLALGVLAAVAYERTGNLWVPVVGYGVLNGASFVTTFALVRFSVVGSP